MLSRETSLANRCSLFAFLKGEVKLPAVNNAPSSLQYFSDFDIIENSNDYTITLCWFLYIIMQIFQLMNKNSKHFYLFIDL